jgi:hypothetical protein
VLFIMSHDNLTLILFNKQTADILEIVCICSILCRPCYITRCFFFARSFKKVSKIKKGHAVA